MSERAFQLILQNDTNTNGYSQWFFFRVSNTQKGNSVNLNIINMLKSYSLYKKGMKILVYSEKKAEKEKIGWHRSGEKIQYYRNSLYKYVSDKKRLLSSLSFEYKFEYDDDLVYFANTVPYRYTELIRDLSPYLIDEAKHNFIQQKTLCKTLAGNDLDYLTITNSSKGCKAEKEGVLIMARIHPGETVSSWMMKGLIEFLTGFSEEANFLRDNFIFKIVPMMNPDGVIIGNYRTSLAGCDLNRRWITPDEILHPEVYFTKQMINKLSQHYKISMVCDFHGHSGAHNIFMYGNKIKDSTACHVFPYILSKISNCFSFEQCSFTMSKSKAGTARINLYDELSIPNIFTMEASFQGSNKVNCN